MFGGFHHEQTKPREALSRGDQWLGDHVCRRLLPRGSIHVIQWKPTIKETISRSEQIHKEILEDNNVKTNDQRIIS